MHSETDPVAGNREPPRRQSGSSWTVRTARWAARHRWPVVGAWFGLTLGLFVASQLLGGIRPASATSDAELSQTESGRAVLAMRNGAETAAEELDVVVARPSTTVTDPGFAATVTAIVDRLGSITTAVGGRPTPAIAGLMDPYAAPASAGLIAPDNAAVRIVGRIEGDQAAIETRTRAIEPVLAELRLEHPGYEIHAYANTLLADEMSEEINRDLDGALWITIPATLAILLVAFGALVAAIVPLVLAVTALLGAFGLMGVFSQTVEPVSPFASQVIVLIGLAVAIDYSLFLISRFRTERRAGHDRSTSIEGASATAGRAVLFSGIAVMVSLAALFLLPVGVFRSMAIGCIAVIAVSVLGSLLFLPAVLALLGDRVDRGRIPLVPRARVDGAGFWTRVVRAVMRRPVPAMCATLVVLLVLAAPVARLRLGEPDITIIPQTVDGVQAARALRDHWPPGAVLTLDVTATHADQPSTRAALRRLPAALLAVDGLAGPIRRATSRDGSVETISVLMSGGANDPANWRIVDAVRNTVVPAVFGQSSSGALYVGGTAAASLDQTRIYTDGVPRVVAFVLGLSFVLLLLVFRSVAIPLKAILLNLLATGAGFGALVLVFQEGWFGAALSVEPTAITNFIPVFVFTTLFGLSMDYEVLILARIREAWEQGMSSGDAVEVGISRTAGTVTSAAAIMVVVFAVFVTLPLGVARQLGLGLAVAVFVDATLIRTVLLPATMRLLGDWNWWLPGFLGWLPRISFPGDPTHAASREVAILSSGTGVAGQ